MTHREFMAVIDAYANGPGSRESVEKAAASLEERARRAEQALRGMVNSHTGECNDGSGECCSACAVALSELEPRCACTWTADFRDHGEARRGPHHNRKVCPMWAPAPSAPATNEEPKR